MSTSASFPLGIRALGALSNFNVQHIQQAIQQMGYGTTGNVYYVDPVNGNDNSGDGSSPANAVATLAIGYALLTSGHNDILILIGNGASTGSARIATFTWAKSACHLIGVCAPSMLSQRARIANATTAGITLTANFFTVSGSGCLFQNISWFHGAGAGQTGIAADICLTVSGQRNAFVNCDIEGMGDATGATDTGSRDILITGGENYFQHCNIGLDTIVRTNANYNVQISNGAARTIFEDCTFLMWSSDGLQCAIYSAGTSSMDRFVLCKRCTAICFNPGGTIEAAFAKLGASAGGNLIFDPGSMLAGFTAIGDATTKAQTWVGGGTATNGVKGVIAT